MKQKILVLTLCFTFLLNSVSFADNHSHEDIVVYETRSGTVAVSLAVVNALLPLAVKAGFEFADSNSMDEFIYRFVGLDKAGLLISALTREVGKVTDGVLTLSSSLMDSITDVFNKIHLQRNLSYVNVDGARIPIVQSGQRLSSSEIKAIIQSVPSKFKVSSSNPTTKEIHYSDNSTTNVVIESWSKYPENGAGVRLKCRGSQGNICSYYSTSGLGDFKTGDTIYGAPILEQYSNGKTSFGLLVGTAYEGKLSSSTVSYVMHICESHYATPDSLNVKNFNVTIGDAWTSGYVVGDDGKYSSDTSVNIVQNPDQLVGQGSSDIDISNPSYDVWTPGQVINPPTTDTPSVEYEEPVIDVPGDDTTTPPDDDAPGDEGSGSTWDWLKSLIQSIVKILESIWEWITGFWDMLTNILSSALSVIVDVLTNIWNWIKEFWNTFTETLGDILSSIFSNIFEFFESFWETLREFIIGLFVPQETYWSDKVTELNEEIKNKFPTVDIEELENLAVGEKKFEDIYATFFGQKCLVVRASLVNEIIGWARPIIQGLICIFLLIFNYNNLYRLLRNGVLTNPSESSHKK